MVLGGLTCLLCNMSMIHLPLCPHHSFITVPSYNHTAVSDSIPIHPRGVIQSLIEKHFPAPDRDRINRLLGLKPDKPSAEFQAILDEIKDDPSGSGGKRKPGAWRLCRGVVFSRALVVKDVGGGRKSSRMRRAGYSFTVEPKT